MSSNEENGKSEKRLMSIGEVSKAIGITRRIILNYEAKGLLLPDKKEGTAGNRYYTPDSISLIRSIRVLQNLGLSLDEISSYYNGSTDLEPLIERLEALRDDLTQSIEKLKQRTASPAASMIQFLTLPAQTVYCRKGAFNGVEERKEFLREVFMEAIHLYGSDSSKRMFFIEYNLEHPEEFTCCISVPPASKGEHVVHLPDQKALGIFYHGCYESLPDARRELSAYAATQARYGILIWKVLPSIRIRRILSLRWLLFYNDSVKQDFLHRYELKASFLQNIHYFQCCGDRSLIIIMHQNNIAVPRLLHHFGRNTVCIVGTPVQRIDIPQNREHIQFFLKAFVPTAVRRPDKAYFLPCDFFENFIGLHQLLPKGLPVA